ncbi:arsenate reductase/protein-tyrosine-phosphatase family protein [Micromonospora tarapacensis]|uniref:arsenate reductase/protein-tyrosine-phosphatase family protein n=1 Tax=Micromonospora tarapacensis TaxID=2835305 RepID=UPI001E48325C|nr:ArsR family transcriptional regulator [Micromonospora tarapacensis]
MALSQPAPAFIRLAGHPLRWQLLAALARSDLRVRELVALVGRPQNLVSYHLRLLRDGGLVAATRSSFDGRDSYYRLDLDRCADALAGSGAALHPALHLGSTTPPRPGRLAHLSVLFVCTGNSARSPIAEALLRRHTAGRVRATSAGSHPQARLHPHAVRVLADHFDVDVAAQRPRHLDTLTGGRFDYVITLCDRAREIGLDVGGRPRLMHWSVPDPAGGGAGYSAFTAVAAGIDTRVRQLLPVLATTNPKEVQP